MEIPGNKSRAGLHPDGPIEMLVRYIVCREEVWYKASFNNSPECL
jgi:hypothetical protein